MPALNVSTCHRVDESNIPKVLIKQAINCLLLVSEYPLVTQGHSTHQTNHDCSLDQVPQYTVWPSQCTHYIGTKTKTKTKKKTCVYYLKNFVNVISMSLAHGSLVTLAKTSLELWTGRFSHPAFTIEFHSKDLVLGMFHYLIARFHY